MTRIKFLVHILLLPVVLFLAGGAKAAAPAQDKQLPKASAKIVDQVAPEKKKPANGKEKLAVLDLDRSGDGIDVDLAYTMSVVLRDALHSYGQYEVLSKEDLMALAKRLALQQGAGDECADDSCLVSYGQALGTRYMVAGVLSKAGNTYSVSVRMLDTEGDEAGVVSRASVRCKCTQDDLFGTVEAVAAKLLGKTPQVSAVVPEVAAPPAPVMATAFTSPPDPALSNFVDPITAMGFVPVPGGCYQMGDIFGNGRLGERPVHEVCVDGFAMGRYEVTQGQWRKVMGNNPSGFQKGDDYPVETVSWDDAQEFIRKLNQQSGMSYRLPTEAEWEYAARSGGKQEMYAGSDDVDAVAWYLSNSGNSTHPVGQKQPNGMGIYDMSGNVWEWVQDYIDMYSSWRQRNPRGPSSGSDRVHRGGGWNNRPEFVRSAWRLGRTPGHRSDYLGFRLVLPLAVASPTTMGIAVAPPSVETPASAVASTPLPPKPAQSFITGLGGGGGVWGRLLRPAQ